MQTERKGGRCITEDPLLVLDFGVWSSACVCTHNFCCKNLCMCVSSEKCNIHLKPLLGGGGCFGGLWWSNPHPNLVLTPQTGIRSSHWSCFWTQGGGWRYEWVPVLPWNKPLVCQTAATAGQQQAAVLTNPVRQVWSFVYRQCSPTMQCKKRKQANKRTIKLWKSWKGSQVWSQEMGHPSLYHQQNWMKFSWRKMWHVQLNQETRQTEGLGPFTLNPWKAAAAPRAATGCCTHSSSLLLDKFSALFIGWQQLQKLLLKNLTMCHNVQQI